MSGRSFRVSAVIALFSILYIFKHLIQQHPHDIRLSPARLSYQNGQLAVHRGWQVNSKPLGGFLFSLTINGIGIAGVKKWSLRVCSGFAATKSQGFQAPRQS